MYKKEVITAPLTPVPSEQNSRLLGAQETHACTIINHLLL